MRYIQWFTREFESHESTRTLKQGPMDTVTSIKPRIRDLAFFSQSHMTYRLFQHDYGPYKIVKRE